MILLKELLVNHIINGKDEEGLVPVDNWRAVSTMYLEDIGFKNDGIFYYALKNPEMKLSYKKKVGFILDDITKKEKKVFRKFKELEDYFAKYKQNFENRPYSL